LRCDQHEGERPQPGRIRDLPAADRQVALWWRKRRLAFREAACPRRSFTQTTNEILPRFRLTGRLRVRLAEAVAGPNQAVSEVVVGVRVVVLDRALSRLTSDTA
jgi:hypothetical protein